MSNMQMREKLRKITHTASHSEQIPEQTKRVGMVIFFILAGSGILTTLIFSIALIVYGHYIGAFLTLVITGFTCYVLYKIQSADDITID